MIMGTCRSAACLRITLGALNSQSRALLSLVPMAGAIALC